ncbi:MAG TPA: TOBE domain-containing protein [Terriglobia bacterium]|nr:TOBE domain-containing protein [Terriglobia bacterium]
MEFLRLPAAARELSVSTPTVKQWIYQKKIRSVKTAGGHHRIPRVEIDRLMFQKAGGSGGTPSGHRQTAPSGPGAGLEHIISGRNQLVGRIVALHSLGLLTKVTLDVGGQRVTAIITRDASEDLRLKVGETAAALIKATEVMIIRPGGRGA